MYRIFLRNTTKTQHVKATYDVINMATLLVMSQGCFSTVGYSSMQWNRYVTFCCFAIVSGQ